MKKLCFIFFLIPSFIFSAPIGNLSSPSLLEEGFIIPDTKPINLRGGFLVYDCFDLVMKFSETSHQDHLNVKRVNAFSNSGLMVLNIKERLDLYAEIGSFRLEPIFQYNSNLYKGKSENNILCRGGAKLILIEIRDFSLSVDAKYSFFNAPSSYFLQNDKPIANNILYKLNEWQIGVGLSQKISILRPYLGMAYKDDKIQMQNTPFFNQLDLVHKKKTGMFIGTSATLGSYVLLNGEIRLIDEKSMIFSGEFRF